MAWCWSWSNPWLCEPIIQFPDKYGYHRASITLFFILGKIFRIWYVCFTIWNVTLSSWCNYQVVLYHLVIFSLHSVVFIGTYMILDLGVLLTHWGSVMYMLVVWNNVQSNTGNKLQSNFFNKIQTFSLKKMHLKLSSLKCCNFASASMC